MRVRWTKPFLWIGRVFKLQACDSKAYSNKHSSDFYRTMCFGTNKEQGTYTPDRESLFSRSQKDRKAL